MVTIVNLSIGDLRISWNNISSVHLNSVSLQLLFLRLGRKVFHTYHVTYAADNLIETQSFTGKII